MADLFGRFFSYHQGFEFVDVARCTTFCPCVCLYQRQTFGHPDSDAFSVFLALRSRFKSGSNRLAASSATTSAKELASMWWKPILFCVIDDGRTSSRCDLTLMTSVTPLRSSISWNRIAHKSPLGPSSHPCAHQPECGCSTSRRHG